MKWLILILGVLSNASASTLIKVAMTERKQAISIREPLTILANWPLFTGVLLYGAAFVLYALALTKLPLNVAHPILTSGSIALVAIASVVMFGERMSILNMLGVLMIMGGVVALTIR